MSLDLVIEESAFDALLREGDGFRNLVQDYLESNCSDPASECLKTIRETLAPYIESNMFLYEATITADEVIDMKPGKDGVYRNKQPMGERLKAGVKAGWEKFKKYSGINMAKRAIGSGAMAYGRSRLAAQNRGLNKAFKKHMNSSLQKEGGRKGMREKMDDTINAASGQKLGFAGRMLVRVAKNAKKGMAHPSNVYKWGKNLKASGK